MIYYRYQAIWICFSPVQKARRYAELENYAVEMLHITKRFPGIVANDDITLQLKKGEIHALLG